MPPQVVMEKSDSLSPSVQQATPPPVWYYYFTADAAAQLPLFQYKGEDRSLLYYYVLSPAAAFLVAHWTPRALAPNAITLIGLMFMIAAYSTMWYYVPTLVPPFATTLQDKEEDESNELPRWIFLLNGIAILVYQTLDNMDGKQARRTGSSSPLGLLFDHGCDALNSLFGSANWIVAMALNPLTDTAQCWAMLFGPYALFFTGTWEEFFTGQLIMPIVNGPNEGLVGGAIMSFTSWYYGPMYWHGTDWWEVFVQPLLMCVLPVALQTHLPAAGLRNADLLVLASSFGFVQEIGLKILNVVKKYGREAFWNYLPFFTLCICSLLVGVADSRVWLDMPRTSLHLCAALFVEMTTALMLAHTTHQPYQPLRWLLFPLVVLTAAVVSGQWRAGQQTQDFLLVYATAAVTYLVFKTALVVHEICIVLNIWCFDIVTPRTRYHTVVPVLGNGHSKAE